MLVVKLNVPAYIINSVNYTYIPCTNMGTIIDEPNKNAK